MSNEQVGITVTLELEMERFERLMLDSGRVVESTTATMEKSTKRAASQFNRLEAALDPLARAQQRLERDTNKVKIAVDKGAITTSRAAKVQAQLNTQYELAVARLNGVTAANGRYVASTNKAAGASRNMGFVVQNAGYQVGDFAVQIASGQGVLRPFIQQGTQLVSMFGPMGAVIGAAGAVAGAFATTMLDTGDSTSEAAQAVEDATKAFEDFQSEVDAARESADKMADAFERAALKALELDEKIANYGQHSSIDLLASRTDDVEKIYADLRALEEAQQAGLQAALGAAGIRAGIRDAANNPSVTAINDEIAANAKLVDALQVSQREYEIVKETLKILGEEGYRGSAEEARNLAEELVGSRGLLRATEDAAKAAQKADEKHEKLTASLEEQIDRNSELIVALRTSEREYELTADTLDLLAKGFQGSEEEARALAEALLEQEDALQSLKDGYREVEREAERAAKETQRVWDQASEGIQDALADAIFEGKDLFSSLVDVAKRTAAEIAAAMIFQPVVSPIMSGFSGGGSGGGISVPGFGGGQVGGGGSTGFGGLGNLGNIFSGGGNLLFNSGAGNFGVDIAQFFGGGAETQALFGNAAGNFGSIAGIGGSLGGNLLANALLGDRGIGASIGGSIGALAGSFIPIPFLGTAIGSFVGNAIGGLFGNQTPSVGPVVGASFTAGGNFTAGVDNEGSMSDARDFGKNITDTIRTILDFTGGDIGQPFVIERDPTQGFTGHLIGGGQRIFGDDLIGALQHGLVNNLNGAENSNALSALANTSASGQDFDTLLEDLNLAAFITSLQSANDNISPLQQAIEGVTEAYGEQISKAQALGLSTSELASAREKEIQALRDAVAAQAAAFNDNLGLRELALAGDNRGILSATLEAERKNQLSAAQGLVDAQIISQDAFNDLSNLLDREVLKSLNDFDAALTSQTAAVNAARLQTELGVLQGVNSASASIGDFLFNQAIGDNSSLTGIEKLGVAQSQFDKLLGDVRGGDLGSIGGLTQAANALLTISKGEFASSGPFVNLENSVVTTLKNLQATITSEQNVGALVADAMKTLDQSQEHRNQALIDSFTDEMSRLRDQFTQLRNELAA